jgi:hypothetical protein
MKKIAAAWPSLGVAAVGHEDRGEPARLGAGPQQQRAAGVAEPAAHPPLEQLDEGQHAHAQCADAERS